MYIVNKQGSFDTRILSKSSAALAVSLYCTYMHCTYCQLYLWMSAAHYYCTYVQSFNFRSVVLPEISLSRGISVPPYCTYVHCTYCQHCTYWASASHYTVPAWKVLTSDLLFPWWEAVPIPTCAIPTTGPIMRRPTIVSFDREFPPIRCTATYADWGRVRLWVRVRELLE